MTVIGGNLIKILGSDPKPASGALDPEEAKREIPLGLLEGMIGRVLPVALEKTTSVL